MLCKTIVLVIALSFWLTSACTLMAGQSAAKVRQDRSARKLATFRDCPEYPEMVNIPAGTYRMGATVGEAKGFIEEGPQHEVRIKSFSVAKYDVTRREWAAFVEATARPTVTGCGYSGLPKEQRANASWNFLGFPQDDRHPVVCVAFQDATEYAAWISKNTGHAYRLLTEAEWEYAARAGTWTAFPCGTVASHESANYGGDEHPGPGLAQGRDQRVGTSPVGSFAPNTFGLYDMNGNVMQWVQDCLSNGYANTPVDGSAFRSDAAITGFNGNLAWVNGTPACSYRMLRGGDWGDPPSMIRPDLRNFAPLEGQSLATYKSAGLGIRLAREDRSEKRR